MWGFSIGLAREEVSKTATIPSVTQVKVGELKFLSVTAETRTTPSCQPRQKGDRPQSIATTPSQHLCVNFLLISGQTASY